MSSAWIVAYCALAALVLLLALLVLGLMRRIIPTLEQTQELLSAAAQRAIIGGLTPGSTVPSFVVETTDGSRFTEADFGADRTVVLFIEDSCTACAGFVQDLLAGAVPELAARLVVVSNTRSAAQHLTTSPDVTVLVDDQRLVAQAFESAVSPQVFVVDPHARVVAVGMPSTWNELRALIDGARGGDRQLTLAAAADVASRRVKEVV